MQFLKNTTRVYNLDVIRTIAIISLFTLHFVLKAGYYEHKNFSSSEVYISILIQSTSFIVIPLFLILTGYLMNGKGISFNYYISIKKILVLYFICSVICLIFDAWFTKNISLIKYGIIYILNYSASHYAWYVNMYIGLYLIIPFLNIGYKALGSKNKKLLLIFVLLVLNALPKTTNIIIFIFPDYWQITYPLSFYFIGSFLSEYNIKFESKLKGLLMLFAGLIADYVFRLYLFNKHGASSQRKSDDLIYIFISVVLFVLINSIDFKREFKIVTSISKMSFSMYLLSYIVDKYIYSLLFNSDMRYGEKFKYIFISVPLVAIISYLLALIVNFIYGIFKKIDKPISDKIYPILESMIKKLALKLDSKDKSLTEKT